MSSTLPQPNPLKKGPPPKDIPQKEFENACSWWCTRDEIWHIFGMTYKTLNKWCRRTYGVTFEQVYKEKSEGGKASLRRAQLVAALKGNPAMLIWLGKQKLGQKDLSRFEHSGPAGGEIVFKGTVVTPEQLKTLSDQELETLHGILAKPKTSDSGSSAGGTSPAGKS